MDYLQVIREYRCTEDIITVSMKITRNEYPCHEGRARRFVSWWMSILFLQKKYQRSAMGSSRVETEVIQPIMVMMARIKPPHIDNLRKILR